MYTVIQSPTLFDAPCTEAFTRGSAQMLFQSESFGSWGIK